MRALQVMYAIWLREIKTTFRERARTFGMVAQPLLYLLIVGQGITSGMSLNAGAGGLDYVRFMYPGIIGMSVLFTSIFSAVSIIWDREFGFLKEVLVAPVPRWAVAVGKILGGATVASVQTVILVALAPAVGVRLTALIVIQLLLISFLISFAVTGLGVLIAARMHSMQGFQMIMNFLLMPMYFLSGGMFPMESAPLWMKSLSLVDPLTYGVDALRNVVLSGTTVQVMGMERSLADLARQAGLVRWDLALDVGIMAAVAVLLAGAGAWAFSRAE